MSHSMSIKPIRIYLKTFHAYLVLYKEFFILSSEFLEPKPRNRALLPAYKLLLAQEFYIISVRLHEYLA